MGQITSGKNSWILYAGEKAANEAQTMWLHRGLVLIAYLPSGIQRGVHNGELLECLDLPGAEGMVPFRDIESGDRMEQPLDFVRDYLRLSYALTGYSSQGRSLGNFETEVAVWTSHAKFDARALFAGTSRARSHLLLQVV